MCVIMQFTDNYPTKEILSTAEASNSHGGGMAWIDDAKGVVRWEKGMHVKAQFIMDKIEQENIQLPIVIHFRIATHGAVDSPLCHPFALTEGNDDLSESGCDSEGVLFHNGVWSDYSDYAMKVAMNKSVKIPDGDLSDSRIMAWLVRHLGQNYLGFIDEKVLVLRPEGILRFGEWSKVMMDVDKKVDKKKEVEIECSNDYFSSKYSYGGSTVSVFNEDDALADEYGYYGDKYSHEQWSRDKHEEADFWVASAMDEEVESLNEQRKREAMDELGDLELNAVNLETGIGVNPEVDLDVYEEEYLLQQKGVEGSDRFKSSLSQQSKLGEYVVIDGEILKSKVEGND